MPRRVWKTALALLLLLPLVPSWASPIELRPPVVVRAVAVESTPSGLVGAIATVSVTVAEGGSGHVFVDTVPLTEIDMQGSVRLAVRVASALTGIRTDDKDFFFVIRSETRIIGGPSAGGVLAVAAVAALKNWTISPSVLMTGTIGPDGSIGPVGGVPAKAQAARDAGATLFLFPAGQETAPTSKGTVDLPSYCSQELGITCRPISTLHEALKAFTGYDLSPPNLTGNVTSERYVSVLRNASTLLLENSSKLFSQAQDALSHPGIPASVLPDLRMRLQEASRTLDSARASFDREEYYNTASRSFQASVESRYVLFVSRAWSGGSPTSQAETILSEVEGSLARARSEVEKAPLFDLSGLMSLSAAETRITDSENSLNRARSTLSNATTIPDLLSALHDAAYAQERAFTATWWLSIGSKFPGGPPTSREVVRGRAREVEEEASETLSYAEAVLASAGAGSSSLSEAESLLEDSRRDLQRGFVAASLFSALEAEMRASLLLELVAYGPQIPQAKLESARKEAREAILESRAFGVEPVLAVAYFEFAQGLEITDPASALSFYKLARIASRLGAFLEPGGGISNPPSERFVGTPPVSVRSSGVTLSTLGLVFALGTASGAFLGLLVTLSLRSSKPPRKETPPPPEPPLDTGSFEWRP